VISELFREVLSGFSRKRKCVMSIFCTVVIFSVVRGNETTMLTFLVQSAEVLNTCITYTPDFFSARGDNVCEMFDLLWQVRESEAFVT
jgi:hypothetical protein